MTRQATQFTANAVPDDAQVRQLRHLLAEMEALLKILPATEPDDLTARLPSDEEVEAGFDNMPV